MAKNHSQAKRTKKTAIAVLCALSVTCTGLVACAPEEPEKKPGVKAEEDTQLLKNGDFEHFDIPDDAVYLIKNVNDWSIGGDSATKSGIIGTSSEDWADLTDEGLADKLDINNDLSSSDKNKVDYNSMKSSDVPYKDTYVATLANDKVADSFIKNQGYEEYFGIEERDGKYYIGETEVYKSPDENDIEYYLNPEHTISVRKQVIENPGTHFAEGTDDKGNVLMVHNGTTNSNYNSLYQYYTSSSITLEANTSAEISVWVKTSDLKFDKGYSALGEQDKGAFIEVIQTVSGNSVDSFAIKNINTEKIISGAKGDGATVNAQNGWLNYTVYVNACDFADSTIQLRLGLGRDDNEEKCTGYAFFDDVKVTKYRELDDSESYKANEAKLANTSCNLTSETEKKIFNADKQVRETINNRHAYDFHYKIDLASETASADADGYKAVKLGSNVNVALTSEKVRNKLYASAKNYEGTDKGGVTLKQKYETPKTEYDLVKNFEGCLTNNDLVGAFPADYNFTKAEDFAKGAIDYSSLLNKALITDGTIKDLPKYGADSNILLMLSSGGAGYTSTIQHNNFTLGSEKYMIVSFWVKTSDMNGKTASTITIYDVKDTDKKNAKTLTVDTTDKTFNFEKQKDIYNGWVNCFFFVENTSKEEKTFNIDFSFGNTTISGLTDKDYRGGWVALANMQTLAIDEDIFKLASTGDYTETLSFNAEDEDDNKHVFDDATSTSDVEKEISQPSKYNGLNGANSAITGGEGKTNYDSYNTNAQAGLLSKTLFEANADIQSKVLTGFGLTLDQWKQAFASEYYQPLIIINNLRTYVEKAEATEDTVTNYLVEVKDGETPSEIITAVDGKKYRKAEASDWKEDGEYFTYSEVYNYGYAGETKTVSADSYQTISVRVLVGAGAEAYIYLVDGKNTANVLSYSTPSYTFYYDEEGNVLDEEFSEDWQEADHRGHIVYTLRDDGLYEDKDGNLFANLYNLIKDYDYPKFEGNKCYDENGNEVTFDNLVKGETYYTSADKAQIADHYLVNSKGDRVYEYKDKKYFYLEDNKTTVEVTNFDAKYARYNYEALNEEYCVKVTDTQGQWKTVNFVIHTGSAEKSYRLELWSGARDQTGVEAGKEYKGAVAFDYSGYSLSSDTYKNVLSLYEGEVIEAYQKLLQSVEGAFEAIPSNSENIAYYEKQVAQLVKDGKLEQAQVDEIVNKYNYNAKYYTYTLYDSDAYVPFNANTAKDGETGYEYKITDFEETLAYFTFENEDENSYNVFVDYSAVDQNIEPAKSEDTDTDEDEDNGMTGDIWLYVSSIILVVVLLATMVAILVRNYLKKQRAKNGKKSRSKNVYRQRDRYIKKLHLVKEEIEDETAEQPEEAPEEVTEETPVEEAPEETTEEVTEETPVEEAPAEVTEETPETEQTEQTDDKKDDNSDN